MQYNAADKEKDRGDLAEYTVDGTNDKIRYLGVTVAGDLK